jgi:hypothetical protein
MGNFNNTLGWLMDVHKPAKQPSLGSATPPANTGNPIPTVPSSPVNSPQAPGVTYPAPRPGGNPVNPTRTSTSKPQTGTPTINPAGVGMNVPGGNKPLNSKPQPNKQYGLPPATGALPSPVQTPEEFMRYFYQQWGRWPFNEEVVGRRVMYPVPDTTGPTDFPTGGEEGGGDYGGGDGGYGGGGGGGGGGVPLPEGKLANPLGSLSWWENSDSIQPLLRGWTTWLKEFMETNKLNAPANPFDINPDLPESTANKNGIYPGFKTSNEVMQNLKEKMGITFSDSEDITSKWQKVINAIPQADFDQQQMLASLRYDTNSGGWYATDIGQLVNPKYT